MKSLVLYFSVTGNTKKVAEEIARQMGSDIMEIRATDAYSKDYRTLMTRGINEVNKGLKPDIYNMDVELERYDMIFIGTPNWLNTYAPAVGTFMDKHEIEGKIIVPFVTYDQGEKGHIDKDIRKVYKDSRVVDAIAIEKNHELTLEKEVERAIARKNLHNLNMPVKH